MEIPREDSISSHPASTTQWPPPSRLVLTLTLTPIVVLIIGGYVAGALFPELVSHHPLALLTLDPRTRNLVLVTAQLSAVSYFSIALVRRFATKPLFFFIGRWYGDAGIRWIEKRSPDLGSLVTTLEGWFPRIGWLLVALYPHPLVCVLAGASKMRLWAYCVYNLLGSAAVVVAVRYFGFKVKAPVGGFTNFLGKYSIPLTILSVLLVVYYVWDGHRKGRTNIEAVEEIERELEEEPIEHRLEEGKGGSQR